MELENNSINDYQNSYNLICDKGGIVLKSYISSKNNLKSYQINFDINSINPKKVNVNNILSHNIYELLEKINPDLVEKIYLLNVYNDDEADILIILRHITRSIGVKQKFMIYNTKRTINFDTNVISFYNKDLYHLNKDLADKYIRDIKLDKENIEHLVFNYGTSVIILNNVDNLSFLKSSENYDKKLDMIFCFDFQIVIDDDLPIYMENITGLVFKKLFFNLKVFIDNIK